MSEWKEVFFEVPFSQGVTNVYGTMTDFNLYLESWDIGYPEPKIQYIEIPGAYEPLDITESISNRITYNNRKLVFTFGMIGDLADRMARARSFINTINGVKCNILVPWYQPNQNYTFSGRVKVQSTEHIEPEYTKIIIECDCSPFMMLDQEQSRVINTYTDAQSSPIIITYDGDSSVIPTITTTCTSAYYNTFDFEVENRTEYGYYVKRFQYSDGIHLDPNIIFEPGHTYTFSFALRNIGQDPEFYFTAGTISIQYKKRVM